VLSSHGFPAVRAGSTGLAGLPATAPIEAGYVPLPVSAIFCTLVRAESLIDKVPVRVPVCVVKFTDAEAIEAQCVELSIVRKSFLCWRAARHFVYM